MTQLLFGMCAFLVCLWRAASAKCSSPLIWHLKSFKKSTAFGIFFLRHRFADAFLNISHYNRLLKRTMQFFPLDFLVIRQSRIHFSGNRSGQQTNKYLSPYPFIPAILFSPPS
jgi:hypothetical protein